MTSTSFVNMPITHIIITGGSGYIGARLAQLAEAQGKIVFMLGRSGTANHHSAVWKLGEGLPPLPVAVPWANTAVIHLAHQWKDNEEESINLKGTQVLLDSARAHGARRFVFVSSQSSRKDALNIYGRVKWKIEQIMNGLDTVSARVGLVYGGPRKGLFGLMMKLVSTFPMLPMLDPNRLIQPIALDEVCRGLLQLAQSNVTGWRGLASPHAMRFREFLKILAHEACCRVLPIIPIPLPFALFVSALIEKIPFMPRLRERVLGLAGTMLLDSRADIEGLGLTLQPVEQYMRESRWGRRALLLEAKVLCGYVLGKKAPPSLQRRYAIAVAEIHKHEGTLKLPRLALIAPQSLRWIEPFGIASKLGRRLRIASTLVEHSPGGATQLLQHGPFSLIKLGFSLSLDALTFPVRLLWAPRR